VEAIANCPCNTPLVADALFQHCTVFVLSSSLFTLLLYLKFSRECQNQLKLGQKLGEVATFFKTTFFRRSARYAAASNSLS